MGRPAGAEFGELFGLGHFAFAIGDLEAAAHTEVADGEDVGTAEIEDENHFGGPAANASDLGQTGDDFLVG